jgi:hypothetical protein
MPITRTPMIDDDGSGTTGTIINNAWKQEIYNQIDASLGQWTQITSTPGMFHGSGGMTWDVPGPVGLMYTLIAQTCFFDFEINSSAVNGPAGAELMIDLPVMPQLPATSTSCRALLLGVWEVLTCQVVPGTPQIKLSRLNGSVFTLGAVAVQGQIFFRAS